MANAFKTFTDTGVGTANADVYTCFFDRDHHHRPERSQHLGGLHHCFGPVLINNDGDNVHIVKDAIVPVGSSLVAVGGDQKIVMNASDILRITGSQASAADVTLSVLEIT